MLALISLLVAKIHAATPYGELLARILEQANFLAVCDNEGLQNSPLGVQQKSDQYYH